MKSDQKSYGIFFRYTPYALLLCAIASLTACALSRSQTNAQDEDGVPIETSLADDQKTIDELRKNIPEDKRQQNDQLKELLTLFGEVKTPPNTIREKYYRITQRIRQKERADVERIRKKFNKEEKVKREEFFKNLKEERDDFNGRKVSREKRKEFYDDQDERRKQFTSDERDKRAEFNSDIKVRTDDFNSMMREKNNEFSQELRAYTARYNEMMANKKKNANQQILKPSDEPIVTSPLQTGDTDQ